MHSTGRLVATALALCALVLARTARATDLPAMGMAERSSGFHMDGYRCPDASVVKDDRKYHMFASRWPKDISFHPGWMTTSEVVHAVSDTPEGRYTFKAVALPARGVAYWDAAPRTISARRTTPGHVTA